MTDGAPRFLASQPGRRGLWQALVDADADRRPDAMSADATLVEAEQIGAEAVRAERERGAVVDLADHAQAHLGYLERVGAGHDAPSLDGDGSASVIDLAEHRSRRALIA